MQAVILAAGTGSRLKELTKNNTKCMVKVNGVSLIERMLGQLVRQPIEKIIIVVGYERRKLMDYIESLRLPAEIEFIENPIYDKTNNIYSLALAKEELLKDDTILLESDLIFEDRALTELIEDPREALMLVDKYERWMDGTCVKLGEGDVITDFIPGKQFDFSQAKDYYKTVNIYKFGRAFSTERYVPALEAYMEENGLNDYYEQVLRVVLKSDEPMIAAKRLDGVTWYEIDDEQDLDIAESLFEEDEKRRTGRIAAREGGYWRYPKLSDFSGDGEPEFPTDKLLAELKANLDVIVTQRPSAQWVHSLLAAKNFGVKQAHILAGNGRGMLIEAALKRQSKSKNESERVGFAGTLFETYADRCGAENAVVFRPQNGELSYTAEELIRFFSEHWVDRLVIANPAEPTGNYLDKAERKKLLDWTKREQITLLWDESLADFADEDDNSMIREAHLGEYPNLITVKDVSLAHGASGLCLGVLACGDEAVIDEIRRDAGACAIDSLAEYYMQIEEKYRKDYAAALKLFREERADFAAKLGAVSGVKVFPSQADYLMIELTDGRAAADVAQELLIRHQILVKDLSKLSAESGRQYLRIAVKKHGENARLVEALERCGCQFVRSCYS